MLAMGLILVGTVIYVAVDKDLSSPSAAKVSIVRLQFMSGERGDLSGSFSLLCVTGVFMGVRLVLSAHLPTDVREDARQRPWAQLNLVNFQGQC